MKNARGVLSDIATETKNRPVYKYDEEFVFKDRSESFRQVVETRRSVRVFKDEQIPREVVMKCLEYGLLAPNSSNLQPWEFIWVRSAEKKKELTKYCFGQPAAGTASDLIVCVGRTDTWKKHRQMMLAEFDKQEHVPKSARFYYEKLVPLVYGQGILGLKGILKKVFYFFGGFFQVVPREPTSRAQMKKWASKTTALACENIMLGFRAHGFDTCPMEGFDAVKVKRMLNIPSGSDVTMILGAGRREAKGIYGDQIRFNKDLFIREV